jgi:hypothetical protein
MGMKKLPICYVYGLFRPDTGQIFYVGMGRGERAWQHQATRKRGRGHKDNIICKMIDDLGYSDIPVVILREGLSQQEAIDLEIALIYAIGRHPHGPLVNATKGGEGWKDGDLSPEFLKGHAEKIRRVRSTPVSRSNTSRQMKAQWSDPSYRAKLLSPGVIAKRAVGIRASRKKPGWKAKASGAGRRMWSVPRFWWTDGTNEIRSEVCPDGWYRGRCCHSNLGQKKTAEQRAAISVAKSGKICITNGINSRYVALENEIPQGWWRGQHH